VYITALTLGKWDRWRDDWVIMQAEVHDRLVLSTAAPMGRRNGWEKVPNLQSAYLPVLKRIRFLAENGLMSMMVLFNFLSKRFTLSSSVPARPGCTLGRMMSRNWSAAIGRTKT
jgi:hypothetical protein